MREDAELIHVFTPEMIDTIAHIWTRSTISLIDVRHKMIDPARPLLHYRMPSSMLVYAYGGAANVQLNETVFGMERFGVFHGGKGTGLSILPNEEKLNVFMVLYKADSPSFFKKDVQRLLEQVNPFVQRFGYSPSNPIRLMDLFQQMLDSWYPATPMNHFHAKIVFYQSIREIYRDLHGKEAKFLQPDPVISTKRYLDEYYMQPILFQDIADMFAISRGQLTRLFKKSEGKSLQEYLALKRLEAARYQLLHTNATVKEIALGCGLVEELNLIRLFKRHHKMTPSEYRNKKIAAMHGLYIDNDSQYLYNEKRLASLVKSQKDGELTMFGQVRSKEMILAALVSLMLLLSACGSNATGNTGGASNQSPAQTQQTQSTSEAEVNAEDTSAKTRIVKTIYGEVEVPVNPERVGVWVYEQEVHALGTTPVAISSGSFENVWPDAAVFSYAPDKEELMSLDPDLLITYDDENFYNEYQSIAPVVNIPLDTSSEETLRMIGDLLNVPEKAEEVIQSFNEQVEASKKLLEQAGALGKTAVLIEPLADDIWFYDHAYGRGGNVLYEYLGFAIPEVVKQQMGDKHFMNVSFEVLPQYSDADYIVVVTGEGYDALKEKEVWKSIPAVKNNKVIEFDGSKLSGRGLDTETLAYFTESFTSIK